MKLWFCVKDALYCESVSHFHGFVCQCGPSKETSVLIGWIMILPRYLIGRKVLGLLLPYCKRNLQMENKNIHECVCISSTISNSLFYIWLLNLAGNYKYGLENDEGSFLSSVVCIPRIINQTRFSLFWCSVLNINMFKAVLPGDNQNSTVSRLLSDIQSFDW